MWENTICQGWQLKPQCGVPIKVATISDGLHETEPGLHAIKVSEAGIQQSKVKIYGKQKIGHLPADANANLQLSVVTDYACNMPW